MPPGTNLARPDDIKYFEANPDRKFRIYRSNPRNPRSAILIVERLTPRVHSISYFGLEAEAAELPPLDDADLKALAEADARRQRPVQPLESDFDKKKDR
jgi:hypothetical protein